MKGVHGKCKLQTQPLEDEGKGQAFVKQACWQTRTAPLPSEGKNHFANVLRSRF